MQHTIDTPKYLKKMVTETAWTQPIATGATTAIDGGNMIISSSNGTGYLAYDGNSGDNLSYEAAWQPLATTGWLKLELPYNIKISSISIKNSYTQRQNMGISGRFYINSNKTTSLGGSFSLTTNNQISTISVNNIVTNTIYLDITSVSSPSYGGIREITITGTKVTETWIAGTPADYDVIVPQVHSINTPKYLKKMVTETAWTQPIATGATTAIDGGNMIISSSNGTGYLAYDGNSGDNLSYEAAWQPLATTGWLKLELPYNIKISSISIKNSYTQRQNMGISGRFYINSNKTTSLGGSFSLTTNNQISTISVNNIVTNTIYLDITSVSSPSYGGIREITITGTKVTETWIAGTPADYDVIVPQVHSINTPKYLKKTSTTVFNQIGTPVGSPSIIEGILISPTTSNYLSVPQVKTGTLSNLQVTTRVRHTGSFSNYEGIIICEDNGPRYSVGVYNSTFICHNGGGYSATGNVAVTNDVWYWLKFVAASSTQSVYVLQDNGYTLDNLPDISQWTLSHNMTSLSYSLNYGSFNKVGTFTTYQAYGWTYWRGDIDLFNTRIIADGVEQNWRKTEYLYQAGTPNDYDLIK